MTSDTARKIQQYLKNGWAPVGYKHQPPKVQMAIRAARFRPGIKECFRNSQHLLLGQSLVEFVYVEGVVKASVPLPIQHAWLQLDGEPVDVTLRVGEYEVVYSHTVPKEEVRQSILGRGLYGPIRSRRMSLIEQAALFGIPFGGIGDDDLGSRLVERMRTMMDLASKKVS